MSPEPGSKHSSDRTDSLKSSLEAKRAVNVGRVVGPAVAKLPVDVFLKHVLPPLHKSFTPAKVGKILAGLKVKHSGLSSAPYSPKEQRWTAFGEVEKATYQALVTISNQITAEVQTVLKGKTPKQLFDFVNEGNAVPVYVAQDSTSNPDAYFGLRDEYRQVKGKKAHMMDIGPTGKYKLNNTEEAIRDNLEKIMWDLTHTMREDARRRFTFAFTVENTNMRLWYASRADLLVSHNFDFMKEPETLLRFFLAFLYATEAQAGWDPTMTCEWDGMTPQYIITVHDAAKNKHKYKTVEMLSDIGAGSLRGRGTRVWKVVPYDESLAHKAGDSKKTELVLKDCWVNKGADKEGDIVQAILADAKKKVLEWEETVARLENHPEQLACLPEEAKFTNDDFEELKRSLLVPSIHSEVLLGNVGIESDKTLNQANLWQGDYVPYYYLWQNTILRGVQTLTPQEHRGFCFGYREREEPVMSNERVHYRVVFEDVCRPIEDEPLLHRAYMYLAMSCQALRLLHKAGWVHRDISVGNILISPGRKVKLADFEYAKRMSSGDAIGYDISVGTRDFMAVEVQRTAYLFLPSKGKPLPSLRKDAKFKLDFRCEDDLPDSGELRQNINVASRPDVDIDIPWLYNPIHDMESLLWLANYFTMGKTIEFRPKSTATTEANVAIPPEPQDEREKRIIRQDNYASHLFYQTDYREKALRSLVGWKDLVHPALVEVDIITILNTVRCRLVERYEEVEKNISVSRQVLAGYLLYQDMAADFIDACRGVERLSHRVVMSDLAREADKIRGKVPVAQLQAMSLQDDSPPGGSDAPDSTPSVIPPDANPVAALGSLKTEKSARKARHRRLLHASSPSVIFQKHSNRMQSPVAGIELQVEAAEA